MPSLFKSPRVTGGLIVFGPFLQPSPSPPPFCQHFNFPGKPLKLISSNHTWLTYGCGKIFRHPSRWPWVKVTNLPKRDAIYLVPTIKWEPLIQSLQNLVGKPPYHAFYLIKFWGNSTRIFFFKRFFCKILNPFSAVEHYICHILGTVGPIDVKQKGNESTGCYAD